MPTFPIRILLLVLALCAIAAYGVPLAQEGGDFVVTVTASTVVGPTATRIPEATTTGEQQATAGEIVAYIANPRRRGTVGIIMSCVLTLFLCVCE